MRRIKANIYINIAAKEYSLIELSNNKFIDFVGLFAFCVSFIESFIDSIDCNNFFPQTIKPFKASCFEAIKQHLQSHLIQSIKEFNLYLPENDLRL